MIKRCLTLIAVGVFVLGFGATLVARNMGFRLTVALDGPGTNLSGTNLISLPYRQRTDLVSAADLLADIGSTAVSIQMFVNSNDGIMTYDGFSGTAFALTPGEAYLVQVSSDTAYVVVGTHDLALSITLDGPGASQSGTNSYAMPFHGVPATADDLLNEINAAAGANVVAGISRFVGTCDALFTYSSAGPAFSLESGKGYFIHVTSDVTFVPAHY